MTKVLLFGQEATESKHLKPIEFLKSLDGEFKFYKTSANPSHYNYVMLFESNYGGSGVDLILAWDDIGNKIIFLGHWNDGVVQ